MRNYGLMRLPGWAFGALAALAAALFAPDTAWAQANNTCGALNAGNSFTESCPGATYANGIVYAGQANSVTLTVPGVASGGTTITAPNTNRDVGIFVRAEDDASAAHNIALTVGGTGDVNIVQHGTPRTNENWRNHGIYIYTRGANGATVTVNVRSGVTIGTATNPMDNRGIHIETQAPAAPGATGAGDISVTSAATIHSDFEGIFVRNVGPGAVMVTNSGAIATAQRGIYVDDQGSAGAITVTSSGAITSTSTGDHEGIFATTTGKDAADADAGVSITHSAGDIAVTAGGVGIKAHVGAARQEADSTHDDYVEPLNEGLAKVEVEGGSVSSKNDAIEAINYEAGSVEVAVSEGVMLTSTHGGGIEARLADVGNASGTIAVTSAATIKAGTSSELTATQLRHGIRVDRIGGSGDVTVTNSGAIEANGYGIFAVAKGGGGAVEVTNSGAIGTAADRVVRGIFASHDGAPAAGGSAGLTVTNSGDVMASDYGVFAQVAAGNSADLTVNATGGSVSVTGHRPAVEAVQKGAGSVTIMVSDGATLTSRRNAGVWARIDHADNAAGRIKITQGGEISGRLGVQALVPRAGATGETRAAMAQPLIDVIWTGRFARGTATAENDMGRLAAADVAGAIGLVREADASAAVRFGQAAGIEAGVLSWRDIATEAAKGDDPGAFADAPAVTALFADDADAATKARAAAIVAQFRTALANGELATVPGAADIDTDDTTGLSDDEIETYLSEDDDDRRMLLRNVLAGSLSEAETAVLVAATTGGDVDGALAAGGATFSDDYKMAVKDLLKRFNPGNIVVKVNGGSINSRGDGVRAWYATPNDKNGSIDITVDEGATVAGSRAGVWAVNAGMGEIAANSDWGTDLYLPEGTTVTLRQQFVTVNGTVTGGSDAAVHLSGGGALIVGAKGKVHAGSSGRAILVNDPGRSEIVIHGEVRGGEGARGAVDVTGGGTVTVGLTGRVMANGATRAIHAGKATAADTRTTKVVLHVVPTPRLKEEHGVSREAAVAALARVQGGFGGDGITNNRIVFAVRDDEGTTGQMVDRALPDGGGNPDPSDLPPAPPPAAMPEEEEEEEQRMMPEEEEEKEQRMTTPPFDCDMASDDRCRLYEALPSVLLAMNGLPTYEERLAAARTEAGGWAQVETARGEWEADSSTRAGVAYDRARTGVRVGVDGAAGEIGRLGVSVHGLRGSADMTQNGGKVELSGVGASVSGTAFVGDGVYIDAQASTTRYEVKLTSQTGTVLKDGAKGVGYALAVEAGRPVAVNDSVTLTPRAGLVWSLATLSGFRDSRNETSVAMEDAESLTGRAGVRAEIAPRGAGGLRVFGSAEATHEFSGKTETRVLGVSLKASPETTGARFALGVAHGWGEERFALQASGAYATGGSGGDGFGGGLSLSVRF